MPDTNVIDLLRALIRFPSLSGEEAAIADFVQGYIDARGLTAERVEDNVFVRLGDGDDRLLLNSHLDIVPPSEDHPFDPFDPVEHEGSLWGRGTVDAKASGAAMLTAVLELAAEGWTPPGQVIVALTANEELGQPNGLETLRPHLPPLSAALVGEPTEMRPCSAQKGLLILNVVAHGQTAHAARAHLGDNAILRAYRDLDRLQAFHLDRPHRRLGTPTVNVTKIQGGTASNVIPDRCVFTLDIRTTPAYTHDEIIEQLQRLLESDVQVHSKRIIPVGTNEHEPIVRAAVAATGQTPFGSPTASDWIFLKDVPTVKIGPGPSERSHTRDEHIELDKLPASVALYKRTVLAYFGEE